MKNSSFVSLWVIIPILGSLFAFTGCSFFGSSSSSGSPSTVPIGPSGKTTVTTLEEERPAVNARINALSQALLNKDVEAALLLYTRKEKYRQFFEANRDNLPLIGEGLKSATLVFVAAGYTSAGIRLGGVTVNNSSHTSHINIVNIKGEWYFQNL